MTGMPAHRFSGNLEIELITRRRCLQALAVGAAATASSRAISVQSNVFTVFTFGDSILDCGRYNEYGVNPGQLIVRNDDVLFPDFKDRDLASQLSAMTVQLDHRARDGGVMIPETFSLPMCALLGPTSIESTQSFVSWRHITESLSTYMGIFLAETPPGLRGRSSRACGVPLRSGLYFCLPC